MTRWFTASTAVRLFLFLSVDLNLFTSGQVWSAQNPPAADPIQQKEHYVMRDGLRIYLWEKYRRDREGSFSHTGKVALLVHGGTRSGRSIYDLQIRDYSLMDFLAKNGYDVWEIDIHGYGHSDKPANDWVDSYSAAADTTAAVEYIAKLRGVPKINLLGGSAGTQRTGVFAMEHQEGVAKLILYAGFWMGTAEFRDLNRKRIENGGKPLPSSRATTEQDFRDGFVEGQFEEDVVEESVKVGLRMDPQRPQERNRHDPAPLLPSLNCGETP